MEAVLTPWLEPYEPDAAPTLAVKSYLGPLGNAERMLELCNLGESIAVGGLAQALGAKMRTLFYVFRRSMGIGPHAYLRLLRLHRLHQTLLAATPEDTAVTRIASDLGFNQMGRLSAVYREHFGEYPSETLKRE